MKVLVADDDRTSRALLHGALLKLGYEVVDAAGGAAAWDRILDRKSTRLNSSHLVISYAVFCLKKKKEVPHPRPASVPVTAYSRVLYWNRSRKPRPVSRCRTPPANSSCVRSPVAPEPRQPYRRG